ncbi:hypothetical protein VUR80DRAFT_4459 [Thermomyces stellatus]
MATTLIVARVMTENAHHTGIIGIVRPVFLSLRAHREKAMAKAATTGKVASARLTATIGIVPRASPKPIPRRIQAREEREMEQKREFQGLTPRWAAVRWKRRRKTK